MKCRDRWLVKKERRCVKCGRKTMYLTEGKPHCQVCFKSRFKVNDV